MRKLFIAVAILTLPAGVCHSQKPEFFPALTTTDLPDAKIPTARIFNGESLFGYIDGGAELYLEYGFEGAHISEIAFMGGKYKTEIYRMAGPEEAFGIFSVSRFRCRSMPPVSEFSCQTRFQLMICSGSYYISIINGSGNSNDSIASLKIAGQIVRKITGPSADLSLYMPGVPTDSIRKQGILVRGRLGVMNGSPDFENFFRDASGYTAVILREEGKTLLSVKFESEADLISFAELHKWKPENISDTPAQFPGGLAVKKLAVNSLLIEITE